MEMEIKKCGVRGCENEAKYKWLTNKYNGYAVCEEHKNEYLSDYRIDQDCDECGREFDTLFEGFDGKYCEPCFLARYVEKLQKPIGLCDMCGADIYKDEFEELGNGRVCFDCAEARKKGETK